MASQLLFNPNTYTGEASSGYISRALLGAKTLSAGLITVHPNVKRKLTIRGVEQGVTFQDATAAFTANGDTTIEERYLNPLVMAVMYEMAYSDLLQSWEAANLRPGAGEGTVPEDLAQFLIQRMQDKINLGIEKLIWQGRGTAAEFTFTGDYDGLLALMEADSNVIKLPGTTGRLTGSAITIANPGVVTVSSTANLQTGDRVTITGANAATLVGGNPISGQTFTITVLTGTTFSIGATTTGTATSATCYAEFVNQSNVVDVLTQVYNATPENVRSRPDFVIYVPIHIADAYKIKQASVSNGAGTYFSTDKPLNFLGKPIAEMPCFNSNTIAATHTANLFFGTDLLSDFNQVQVIDMRNTTAEQKVRYRSSFASDVNFGYGSEIVLYRPA
ncbi:MAG: hypothetical protein V4543_11660 [Bacteroidota bacterium]